MNNYPILRGCRDYFIINKEGYDTSEGLEENDLKREKERVMAFFSKQFGYVVGSTIAAGEEIEAFSLLEQITELQRENYVLQQQILELKNKLDQLIETLPTEKTVVLREISREEAKQEIEGLFASTDRVLYYSDIAERLGLELRVVVKICKELIKEGEIKIDAKALRNRR